MSQKNAVTLARLAVLRALASGHMVRGEVVRKAMSRFVRNDEGLRVIAVLLRDSLIAQVRNGYVLLPAGARLLPSTAQLPAMRAYQPPAAPPRREGSDWQHLPSVYSGEPQTYKPHC